MYVCMYVCMHIVQIEPVYDLKCMYVCMYACMYVQVPEGDYEVELGVGKIMREGSDVTLVGWGAQVHVLMKVREVVMYVCMYVCTAGSFGHTFTTFYQ